MVEEKNQEIAMREFRQVRTLREKSKDLVRKMEDVNCLLPQFAVRKRHVCPPPPQGAANDNSGLISDRDNAPCRRAAG